MDTVTVEVWLYGPIARYAGEHSQGSHARLDMTLPAGSSVHDILVELGLPDEERGIIFVNGSLASLPGLDAKNERALQAGDRVGISHRRSMWPFQYRFGASLTPEVEQKFSERKDRGVHHTYTRVEE